MAQGDKRYSRQSYGGSGYSYDYDDEGRGRSNGYWQEFESGFKASGFSADWLLTHNDDFRQGLPDGRLNRYVSHMTYRYNIHDWADWRFDEQGNTDNPNLENSLNQNDGRVRRIVVKKCGLATWHQLQRRAKEVYNRIREEDKRVAAEKSAQWEEERAHFNAERIKREEEEKQAIMKEVDLIAGTIQSDFHQAYDWRDQYALDDGDYLDDVVAAVTSGYGFGEEVSKPQGLKMQITVSLDKSNSMNGNRLSKAAAQAFRDIYLALMEMRMQYPDSLFVGAFEFCLDGYEANERGREANCISHSRWEEGLIEAKSNTLGAVERYRNPEWAGFTGEDTWFYPLFEQIEKWERKYSDPGAYRLDLVITDAVLEHPSDIKRSDVIQERRDGSLQTVLLNLLPEEDWVNSDLPMRCVQYPANVDNLGGMLRNIINEFVGTHM